MNPNDNQIKLSGTASIPEPLQLGHDYKVEVTANAYKVEAIDNQDGSFDKIHKLKIITAEITDGGRKISAKVKGSQSKLFRFRVIEEKQLEYPDMDDEEAYNKVMSYLLDRVESIVKNALQEP